MQYDAVVCQSVNHCWNNKGRMFLGYIQVAIQVRKKLYFIFISLGKGARPMRSLDFLIGCLHQAMQI